MLISICCYKQAKLITYTFVLSNIIEMMKRISLFSKWDQDHSIKGDKNIMVCDIRDGCRILILQVWVGLVCYYGCLNWLNFRVCSMVLDGFLGFCTLKCSRCGTWNFGLKEIKSGVNVLRLYNFWSSFCKSFLIEVLINARVFSVFGVILLASPWCPLVWCFYSLLAFIRHYSLLNFSIPYKFLIYFLWQFSSVYSCWRM